LSRIIRVQETPDENSCRPHLFPRLTGEESTQDYLPKEKPDNFVPGCLQGGEERGEKTFEAIFHENEEPTESDASEQLAEEHAREVEESFTRGFVEGENSGTLAERQRVEPALEMLQAAALELHQCRESLIADFEKASVELAIAIAEKIVCHEVSTNRETIVDILKRATQEAGGNEILKIRINPSDLQYIQEAGLPLPDLTAEDITLEGDGAVPDGGCIIETDFGCVDATIPHQLEAVAEALREKC
jgi:flagellar assembly protein FliH